MFSLCLRGFFPATPASSHDPDVYVKLTGESKLNASMNGCSSIYVSSAIDWQPVQAVVNLSHYGKWDIYSIPFEDGSWKCQCFSGPKKEQLQCDVLLMIDEWVDWVSKTNPVFLAFLTTNNGTWSTQESWNGKCINGLRKHKICVYYTEFTWDGCLGTCHGGVRRCIF